VHGTRVRHCACPPGVRRNLIGGNLLDATLVQALERKRMVPSVTHVSRAVAGKAVPPSYTRFHLMVSCVGHVMQHQRAG
jgi:hypothetical protein